ncbi:class I SAM-dependent methyltransferase [Candidatus Pacearchaeota archaeon]|nr:class I SAM-dependent methyltransferase [Candidatus Pacearchaeota archaeon]
MEERKSQKQVWDNIAPDWYKFKIFQSPITTKFLHRQKGNILDFGSGAGRYLIKIKNAKLWLVDFSEEMIKLAKKRAKQKGIKAEFAVAEITKLPHKNNFFNAAIAIASFHCLNKKQHKKAAKELYHILKPGAKVQIAVWNKDSPRFKNAPKEKYVSWRDKGKRYYYLFTEKEIYNLFEKAGFKIIKKYNEGKKAVNIIFVAQKPRKSQRTKVNSRIITNKKLNQ